MVDFVGAVQVPAYLFHCPFEVIVGLEPAVADGQLPLTGLQVRASLRAKHGRAVTCQDSPLGITRLRRQQHGRGRDKACADEMRSHSCLPPELMGDGCGGWTGTIKGGPAFAATANPQHERSQINL